MVGIDSERRAVFLHLISQFKKEVLALVVPLEKWLDQYIPLGQITGILPGIAGGRCRRQTVLMVHEGGHGFMERHILGGQIIIVPVVGVIIFQLLLVDGYL